MKYMFQLKPNLSDSINTWLLIRYCLGGIAYDGYYGQIVAYNLYRLYFILYRYSGCQLSRTYFEIFFTY